MEEFVKSYETARTAGFDNINIDLMSALPGQTFESFLHTLDTVLALKPEHISMYSLILEEGTALYEHLDRYPALPDEDTERQMYDTACLRLADNGYHQYEISNFAKPGFESRHNLRDRRGIPALRPALHKYGQPCTLYRHYGGAGRKERSHK